jgi:competence protein ComEA
MSRRQVDAELRALVARRLDRLLADWRGAPVTEATVGGADPSMPRFGRRHLAVVAVLLLLGVAAAGWTVLRDRPVAVATGEGLPTTSLSTPVPPAPTGRGAGAPSATASPGVLVVHVLGAVRKPGVVTLPEPARVLDAIRAAGGLRERARTGDLNLAQVLSDGEQVIVGTDRRPGGEVRGGGGAGGGGAAAPGPGGAAPGRTPMVDLNSAELAELESLPGIGPVTAGKILSWREKHGRFSRIEELQEIDGIGPKTYADLAPHVRV